ncbi:hypothetical protein BC829DRAFT_380621, partial [Chytridium lagenaria]
MYPFSVHSFACGLYADMMFFIFFIFPSCRVFILNPLFSFLYFFCCLFGKSRKHV